VGAETTRIGDRDIPTLRLGDWREVLVGVTCDSLITDPPYSARTDAGFRSMTADGPQGGIGYDAIDEGYVQAFVDSWAPRVRSWWVVFGDHVSSRWWAEALDKAGLLVFAPLIWCKLGAAPRFQGDGPASQVEHITVARRRDKALLGTGSRPGWYQAATVRHGHGYEGVTGAKPLDLMRAIVLDYSSPGWTVVDPHAGSGTTILACAVEGRVGIGSEQDAGRHEIARRRLAQPMERSLFEGPARGWQG